jgi:hypothetical protein
MLYKGESNFRLGSCRQRVSGQHIEIGNFRCFVEPRLEKANDYVNKEFLSYPLGTSASVQNGRN